MSYYVVHLKRKDDHYICEESTRNVCTKQCPHVHHSHPFLWQVLHSDMGWLSVQQGEQLEMAYSNPANVYPVVQTGLLTNEGSPVFSVQALVDFSTMSCDAGILLEGQTLKIQAQVRRLSTPSYMQAPAEQFKPHDTVWTWYWQDGSWWKAFGVDSPIPTQCVLEAKYLGGQQVFRFEVDTPDSPFPTVFLVNFNSMSMNCMNNQKKWIIARRPQYGTVPHPRKALPYSMEMPDNWAPLDIHSDFELVPLNPSCLEYHLVSSEFISSLPSGRTILDIFRLQNPFLWSKYQSKKLFMASKGKSTTEMQLFHGTSDESAVQSIFRQNFDWRMAGKNATVYGTGSYFATHAKYSDRYTGPPSRVSQKRWMFMARVMVGQYTAGKRDMTRPPPLNPAKPHGDLYDSCVDNVAKPNIFVIFDIDQCYPEYILCYSIAPQSWANVV